MDIKLILAAAGLFMYARSKKAAAAPANSIAVGEKSPAEYAESQTKPLNVSDLDDVPYVDEVNLSVEAEDKGREAVSNKVRAMSEAERHKRMRAARWRAEMSRRMEERIGLGSYQHGKMLERSLSQRNDLLSAALMQKFEPFQRSSSVRNPLLGFVDGEAMGKVDADFSIYDAVPAQEFNSIRSAKDIAGRDFPLVKDDSEKGDFAGVLLSERGSPDFSTMIVNEAKSDFGRWRK